MRARKYVVALRALMLLWPPSLLAATATFGQAVGAIERIEVILVFLLSTLSGVTAFLIRYSRRINETPLDSELPPIRNLPLLISSHMAGSWLAGIMAFFSAAHWGMPGLLVGFFVPAVSFGGAKACEVIYTATIGRFPGYTPAKD